MADLLSDIDISRVSETVEVLVMESNAVTECVTVSPVRVSETEPDRSSVGLLLTDCSLVSLLDPVFSTLVTETVTELVDVAVLHGFVLVSVTLTVSVKDSVDVRDGDREGVLDIVGVSETFLENVVLANSCESVGVGVSETVLVLVREYSRVCDGVRDSEGVAVGLGVRVPGVREYVIDSVSVSVFV